MTSTRYNFAPQKSLAVNDEVVFVLESENALRIDGPGMPEFLGRLSQLCSESGSGLTSEEIAKLFEVEEAAVLPLLNRLVELEVVIREEEGSSSFATLAAQRSGGQHTSADVQRNLNSTLVQLVFDRPSALSNVISAALTGAGVQMVDEDADLTVVIGNSEYDSKFFEFNRTALEDSRKRPWLAVIPFDGGNAWVGPFQLPHRSACYTCFRLRRSGNFSDEVIRGELLDLTGLPSSRSAVLDHPVSLVQAGIVANLVTDWAALREYAPSAVPGAVARIGLDAGGISLSSSRTLRVPRCPDCSPAKDTGSPQVWFHRADTDLDHEHPVNAAIGMPGRGKGIEND